MKHYALVSDFTVTNVVAWDGVTQWSAPAGSMLLQLAPGEACGPGWSYLQGQTPRFVPPQEVTP